MPKKLLTNWILHFLSVSALLIFVTLVSHMFTAQLVGNANYYNLDGTSPSVWYRVLNHKDDLLILALFTLLTEIVRQFIFKRYRHLVFGVGCLLVGLLSGIGLYYLHPFSFEQQGLLAYVKPMFFMATYTLLYVIVIDYFHQNRQQKLRRIQQTEQELNTLKAQLNPHFLFNALNYLYGTALKEKATDTAQGIDSIADMMRYTINGIHKDFVPLVEELTFMENYLHIQQVRLPERQELKIQTKIQADTLQHGEQIAPLLLLPFIENAFKYGLTMDGPCELKVSILAQDNLLQLEVFNTMVLHRTEAKGNNTGIQNTIKRLDLLYPNRYKLIQENTGINYRVSLSIQLRP